MVNGKPSITFLNETTRQVAIFDRENRSFISAYPLSKEQIEDYLETNNIGDRK